MKRLIQLSLIATLILLLTGCNPVTLVSHNLNPNLPKVYGVKALADNTSIGFEWQPLVDKKVDGMNIYRTQDPNSYTSGSKQFVKIATINSPFVSHYVDTGLQQNSTYSYTFTTIKGGYESLHGQVLEVKTLPPLQKVSFFQGAQRTPTSVKLIWRPHPDKRIKRYRIERSLNDKEWKIIGYVENRMMVEYIDNYVVRGNTYKYRVLAIGFDGSTSRLSDVVTIKAR